MAQNEPKSPVTDGLNAPQDIDREIAIVEGKLKSDYLGANVVIVLGVAMPLLLLGLKYMQAISFGGAVQVFLWAIILVSGLMGIGIATNIGEFSGQLNYLQQQKSASVLKFTANNAQLQRLVYETLQHLNRYYHSVGQQSNRSALFFSAMAVTAMLLGAASVLGLNSNQGIGNYILLGSAILFAVLAVFAYVNNRKENIALLDVYGEKLSGLQELTTYLYLFEKSTDEEEKKLMTQKMIDNFLNKN